MSPTTECQQLAALRAAQAWYDAEIGPCPRSSEWKLGARAGAWKAHGLAPMPSPYKSGSAADDARNAGFAAGYQLAQRDIERAWSVQEQGGQA